MSNQAIIQAITELVEIPSTEDNPAGLQRAVDFMADFVTARADVTIERFERNGKPSFLAYRGTTRPAIFDVLLNAHLDVVPGAKQQFKAVVQDGNLFGRGAFDMKAAAICEAVAFCEMVTKVPYALGLQIVSDEEVGGYNGAGYQVEQGVRADFILAGEHTFAPNVIYTAARGIAWAEVGFRGKTAHGGYPWRGRNALAEAVDYVHDVLERYPIPAKETWATSVNISSIQTSNASYNSVPHNAVVKLDFRFTPENKEFESREAFRELLVSFNPEIEILDIPVFDPAISVDHSNKHLQALEAALRETCGEEVVFDRRYAGGDARHFALVGGNAVEFGLTGAHMHAEGEYVNLDAIDNYLLALKRFLANDTPYRQNAHKDPSKPESSLTNA
jgi:succinyl-diaminopimelate desuccinylase